MRTKLLVVVLVLGGLLCGNAQEALSAYKYVIVPTKFDALRKENQYQTSTLVKYLLVQNGFNAVYENSLPPELFSNRCLGLKADLIEISGMLSTKTYISFVDCDGVEVYKTAPGSSKIKTYKEAYREAITESFQSLSGYTYTYSPAEKESPVTISFEDDVKTLEPETKAETKVEEQVDKVLVTPVIPETPEVPEIIEKEVIEESPVPEIQEKEEAIKEIAAAEPITETYSIWYAQEIANGFQLVDSSPKVRLRIYKTQKEGIFLAKGEDYEGVVYNDEGSWYLDYYLNGELVHQVLNIKF